MTILKNLCDWCGEEIEKPVDTFYIKLSRPADGDTPSPNYMAFLCEPRAATKGEICFRCLVRSVTSRSLLISTLPLDA